MRYDSSPDPLSAENGPSISVPSQRSPSKRKPPSPTKRRLPGTPARPGTSVVNVHSPTKMTATPNSVLSPWRIKVVVEAERDDEARLESSSRVGMPPNFTLGIDQVRDLGDTDGMDVVLAPQKTRRNVSRSVGVRTHTTTVKVPLKGLSSSPENMSARRSAATEPSTYMVPRRTRPPTPATIDKPSATPRRKKAATANAKATDEDYRKQVESAAERGTGEESPINWANLDSPRATRKSPRKPQAPAIDPARRPAPTRLRRTSLAPPTLLEPPKPTSVPSKNSAPPAAKIDSGRSTPRRILSGMDPNSSRPPSPLKPDSAESRTPAQAETAVPSSGRSGRVHLGSEGESFSLPDFAASFNSSTGDISGFFDESMEGQQEEIISEEDVLVDIPEEEALADVLSGPAWKMSATISSQDEGGQSDFDFTYLSPSFGGKYGLPPGNSVLQNNPEGAGKFLGSSAADGRGSNDIMESLSILPDGRSGAGVSHSFKSPTNPRDEIQFNSITAKEPLKDIIKQEDMETERAFFASSPPFIPSQNKSSGATPRNKRTHETDVSGSSASRRKTAHRTPSLARIREASEVISDGLDADESMAMAEQDVGVGFGGPPTPESQEQYPPLGAMADDADSSYPSLLDLSNQPEVEVLYPSLDPTGIPSPPLSQAAVLTTTGYIGQILPPFKNSEPIKPVTASTAPTAPPTNTSRVPRTRSVHLEDETSLDARVREFDRVVMLETKWAREREENIQRARGMKVISIDETDEDRAKALLEDWERERTLVRKQARETGAITIDDTEEENTTARDTAGPSTTRSAEPRTDNTTLVSVSKRGMAIPSSNIIAPTTGHSVLQDSILDDIDITIATSSGLTWTKENYKRLSTILVSKSTDPKTCKKRYSVQLDRPARLLSTEVLTLLDLDADGYLRLSTTESAAVDRFCRREKAFGRDWKKTEVVRRVAGLRVADVRARVVGRRKRK